MKQKRNKRVNKRKDGLPVSRDTQDVQVGLSAEQAAINEMTARVSVTALTVEDGHKVPHNADFKPKTGFAAELVDEDVDGQGTVAPDGENPAETAERSDAVDSQADAAAAGTEREEQETADGRDEAIAVPTGREQRRALAQQKKQEARQQKAAKKQAKRDAKAARKQSKGGDRDRRSAEQEADRLAAEQVRAEHRHKKEAVNEEYEWYKIDNAGIIFVPAKNRSWTSCFRLSCVLKEPIDGAVLQAAVNDVFERFPTMMVYLRSGLFWNYLETAPKPPLVEHETSYPCRRFDIKARAHLMRVLYAGNRIAVEFFHAVTDGNGGTVYLLSLVKRYLELRYGIELPSSKQCPDHRDIPTAEEKEDSFARYADHGKAKPYKESPSLRLPVVKAEAGRYYLTHAVMSASAVKARARELGASVGEFLAACALFALRTEYLRSPLHHKTDRPLKLCIPIDLRRIKSSTTLRNFVLSRNVAIDVVRDDTVERILSVIKPQFSDINEEYVQATLNKNVGTAMNPLVRIMPLPLKNLAMGIGYDLYGDKLNAMSLSNIGRIDVPEELAERIERLEFMLGPGKLHGVQCGVITLGDRLVLSMGANCKNHNLESRLVRTLMEQGLSVEVDTNRRSCNGNV